MRLIDADVLKKDLKDNYVYSGFSDLLNDFYSAIDEQPTADVPERNVGEWVVIMDEPTITFDECKCSECGVVEYFNKGWKKFNYCPNCGARMKGEDDGGSMPV